MPRASVTAATRLLDRVGLLNPAVRSLGGRYIMAYHRVLPPDEALAEWSHHAIWIRPETLDEHLSFFSRVGRIVSLDELLGAKSDDIPLFSITFDDAWIDNLTYALPVLDKHAAQACFFVATDAVTSGRLFWTEEVAQKLGAVLEGPQRAALIEHLGWPPGLAGNTAALLPRLMACIEALKELPPEQRQQTIENLYAAFGASPAPVTGRVMNWDQIRSLAARGHTIGSHSKSHLILRNVDVARVDEELVDSKHIIEERLSQPVKYFCFPNARYDEVSSERVLAAGYSHGFRIHNLKVTSRAHKALTPRFSASESNAHPSFLKARFVRASLQ
jgi:peptidoglycan/xylan/chitin deacetylase (PgdA/CDA1 family)